MLTAVEKALTDDGGTRMCRKSLCQPCFVILMTLAHKHPPPLTVPLSPVVKEETYALLLWGLYRRTHLCVCMRVCAYVCVIMNSSTQMHDI